MNLIEYIKKMLEYLDKNRYTYYTNDEQDSHPEKDQERLDRIKREVTKL